MSDARTLRPVEQLQTMMRLLQVYLWVFGAWILGRAAWDWANRGFLRWGPTVERDRYVASGLPETATPFVPVRHQEVPLLLDPVEAPLLAVLYGLEKAFFFACLVLTAAALSSLVRAFSEQRVFDRFAARRVRRLGLMLLVLPLAVGLFRLMSMPSLLGFVEHLNGVGSALRVPADWFLPHLALFLTMPLGFLVWLLGGVLEQGADHQAEIRATV